MPNRIIEERVRQLYKGEPTKSERIKPILSQGYNFNSSKKARIIRKNLAKIKKDPNYAKRLMGN